MASQPKKEKFSPPTVRDIARVAGVAVGSVSRALNDHADINPEMRDRILSAARKLKYSRLRRKTVRGGAPGARAGAKIALVCFGMEDTLVQLPVVSVAMHGIEEAVAAAGGTLMFANIPRGDRVPAFLSENQVGGIIVKGPNVGLLPPELESPLLQHIYRLPHVWLLGQLPNGRGDHCNFDQTTAGRLAADYLFQKGHKQVAFLNPKPGHAQFEGVKRAFCLASRELGAQVDIFEPVSTVNPSWPLPAISSQETVGQLAQQWMAIPAKRRPTAIAVGADTTAVQLYGALAKLGVQAGRDVGVISCNDERSLIMGLEPGLTTINVLAESVGRNAVARLLWRMAQREDEPTVRILIQPILVERHSVPKLN